MELVLRIVKMEDVKGKDLTAIRAVLEGRGYDVEWLPEWIHPQGLRIRRDYHKTKGINEIEIL